MTAFANLLNRENRKWWYTRRWWTQAILWMAILFGFSLFGLFVMPGMVDEANAQFDDTENYPQLMTSEEFKQDVPNAMFGLASLFLPVGVIILTQAQVYGEKQSGVAAWILSKPVSRPAYLLAKFLADLIGIIILLVILPLSAVYLLSSQQIDVDAGNYLMASGIVLMLLVFYQAFTLMMSVVGHSSEVVLGASFGVLLSGFLLKGALAKVIGDLIYATPWVLSDAISLAILGDPIPDKMTAALIITPLLSVLCLVVMIWQFNRQEL